jgi:hypothetical protein
LITLVLRQVKYIRQANELVGKPLCQIVRHLAAAMGRPDSNDASNRRIGMEEEAFFKPGARLRIGFYAREGLIADEPPEIVPALQGLQA